MGWLKGFVWLCDRMCREETLSDGSVDVYVYDSIVFIS